MTDSQSLLSLFWNASILVKSVMLLLLAASVLSWTFILQRWQIYNQAKRQASSFDELFWSGPELTQLYQNLNANRKEAQGLSLIFLSGFKEFTRLHKQEVAPEAVMQGAERMMRIAFSHEMERLEAQLPFLATVGSVSPYVGLFGTVWGIMNSFRALGAVQQATLSMVAPGIAEALVATAMGLFAAIPAVIAYNRFSNHVQLLNNRYLTFLEELTAILHRKAYLISGTSPKSLTGSYVAGNLASINEDGPTGELRYE